MKYRFVLMGDKLVKVGFPDVPEIKCYIPNKRIKSMFTLRSLSEVLTIYQYQQYELRRVSKEL